MTAIQIDRARTRRARAVVRKSRATATQSSEIVNVKAILGDYDEAFLECRDLGHTWRALGYFRSGGEINRRLECRRCKSNATDVWRTNGERVKRDYRHAEGYLIAGVGVSGVSRAAVRLETLRRVTVYGSEDALLSTLMKGGRK